jgi:hypothetical protein
MRNLEDLLGALSKFVNLTLNSHFLNWILYFFNVNHPFISEGMEEVESFYCLLTSLLVAEY